MTGIGLYVHKWIGILLALTLLTAFAGGAVPDGAGNLPVFPDHEETIVNAALTVRTQKKAYKIDGGIKGIDVSKYQGSINWQRVANDGIDFAFVRAAYGTTNDPYFLTNAKNAHENGIKVGAYHFATFKTPAEARKEAAYFVNLLKKVDITYPVVLDLEGASHKKISRAGLTSLAKEFMDVVKAEGYTVMLYTYNNFIRDHLSYKELSGYDLWIANYLEFPSNYKHKVWQHSNTGKVDGIKGNVDLNVAYEDLSTNKQIKVSKDASGSIKETLNERYGVGLPLDGLNMDQMNAAIITGLKYEVTWQWGVDDLYLDGHPDQQLIDYLSEVTFTENTHGYITYLIQAKLFYMGHYKNTPSSWYDSETVEAVRSLQRANDRDDNGVLDEPTLRALLM